MWFVFVFFLILKFKSSFHPHAGLFPAPHFHTLLNQLSVTIGRWTKVQTHLALEDGAQICQELTDDYEGQNETYLFFLPLSDLFKDAAADSAQHMHQILCLGHVGNHHLI